MDWKKIESQQPVVWSFLRLLASVECSRHGGRLPNQVAQVDRQHESTYWFWFAAGFGGALTKFTLWLVVKVSGHGKTILHAMRRMFRNNRNVTSDDVTEIKTVSQAEYDAGPKNPTTVYLIKNGGEDGLDDVK